MRAVILHYHIYKNSGTSFDRVLAHNFGGWHESFDGPYPFFTIDQDQLDRIITRRPKAVAFSSHQIILPQPSSVDYRAFAAIFVRNPFLRIASIYRFKRGPERPDGSPLAVPRPDDPPSSDPLLLPENIDRTTTGIAARQHDFAGWVEYCLTTPAEMVHVSNAQTRYFATPFRQRPAFRRDGQSITYDLSTALRALAGVELLGRTEHFEQDVTRFSRILAEHRLTLNLPADTRHNVTETGTPDTAGRVEALLSKLPPDLRARLVEANRQDLALYDRACELIERDHRP